MRGAEPRKGAAPAPGSRDRREALSRSTLNGIDFVEVVNRQQTKLRVHFQNEIPLAGYVARATITGGESIPSVQVLPFDEGWSIDQLGRPLLTLRVAAPGDFSTYTLTLESGALDPYFSRATFSFKARCASTLDCAPAPVVCPGNPAEIPPIDYLAKDFSSFRRALSDFSALRYPAWRERAEADLGVMLLEALSAVADDLSYLQDRIAAEAYLDTATERRSLVRHARLVDYEPRPATAARALLRLTARVDADVPAGLSVRAAGPDGAPVEFETGEGLSDPERYPIRKRWNAIRPYAWDNRDRCLLAGATEVSVVDPGHALARGRNALVGRQLLIETSPEQPGRPPLRQLVRITGAEPRIDPMHDVEPQTYARDVTLLRWRSEDALARDRDLARTVVAGNLVPATQGSRVVEAFVVDDAPRGAAWPVVTRLGPTERPWEERLDPIGERIDAECAPGSDTALDRADAWVWGPGAIPQHMYTLRRGPLAWLASESAPPLPEIRLSPAWTWRRRLLDAAPSEESFTLDPIAYRPVGQPGPDRRVFYDHDGRGDTIRFGDGTFGAIPAPGAIFEVTYRVGGGARGNVAAGAITQLDPNGRLATLASAVTNPFAAAGGADEESVESIRRLAPEAFRAEPLRAVLPRDYEAAVEALPWVQRAGTTVRYTGSWLTLFTAADPRGSEALSPARARAILDRIERVRLAGHASYVIAPRFVSLDLDITVCARPDAFRGGVEAAVLAALGAGRLPDGTTGFFHPDRFTFGQALERSALRAAIQRVPGVDGVRSIRYRRRGRTHDVEDMPERVPVGPGQIIRVNNDPSRPERGSVRVHVKGGK